MAILNLYAHPHTYTHTHTHMLTNAHKRTYMQNMQNMHERYPTYLYSLEDEIQIPMKTLDSCHAQVYPEGGSMAAHKDTGGTWGVSEECLAIALAPSTKICSFRQNKSTIIPSFSLVNSSKLPFSLITVSVSLGADALFRVDDHVMVNNAEGSL